MHNVWRRIRLAWWLVAMVAVVIRSATPLAAAIENHTVGPLTCNVGIDRPNADQLRAEARVRKFVNMRAETGASYLFVGGKMHHDFAVRARLTLPKVVKNRGPYYSNAITLVTYPPANASLSISMIRSRETGYRNQIAFSWVLPGGDLVYQGLAPISRFIVARA